MVYTPYRFKIYYRLIRCICGWQLITISSSTTDIPSHSHYWFVSKDAVPSFPYPWNSQCLITQTDDRMKKGRWGISRLFITERLWYNKVQKDYNKRCKLCMICDWWQNPRMRVCVRCSSWNNQQSWRKLSSDYWLVKCLLSFLWCLVNRILLTGWLTIWSFWIKSVGEAQT